MIGLKEKEERSVNTEYARSVASMNASGVGPHLLRAFIYAFRVGGLAHAWVADTGVVQRLIQHLNVQSFPNFAQLSHTTYTLNQVRPLTTSFCSSHRYPTFFGYVSSVMYSSSTLAEGVLRGSRKFVRVAMHARKKGR